MARRTSLFVCLLLLPFLTAGFRTLPGGVGDARFGMSVEEVKRHFPTMAQTQSEGQLYRVTNQQYEKLKNCTLDFYFYKDRLMQVAVYYNDNTQQRVEKFLRKQYGSPTQDKPTMTWNGEKTVITFVPASGQFVVMDKAIMVEAVKEVLKKVR